MSTLENKLSREMAGQINAANQMQPEADNANGTKEESEAENSLKLDLDVYTMESLQDELKLHDEQLKRKVVQKYIEYRDKKNLMDFVNINLSLGLFVAISSADDVINSFVKKANKELLDSHDYFVAYDNFNEDLQKFKNCVTEKYLEELSELLKKGADINFYQQWDYSDEAQIKKIINILNVNPMVYNLEISDCSKVFEKLSPNYYLEIQKHALQFKKVRPMIGFTPLMLAVSLNLLPVVKFLLDKGADINQTNILGHSALTLACSSGYDDIANLLLDRGAMGNEVFLPSYQLTHITVNDYQINQGNPRSTLNVASMMCSMKVVKKIVENNKEIQLKNFLFTSPYFYANYCYQAFPNERLQKKELLNSLEYLKSISILHHSKQLAKEYAIYYIQNNQITDVNGALDYNFFISHFPQFKEELHLLTLARLYLEYNENRKRSHRYVNKSKIKPKQLIKKTNKHNLEGRLKDFSSELCPALLNQAESNYHKKIKEYERQITEEKLRSEFFTQSRLEKGSNILIMLIHFSIECIFRKHFKDDATIRKLLYVTHSIQIMAQFSGLVKYTSLNIKKSLYQISNDPEYIKELKELAQTLPYFELAESIPTFTPELLTTVMEYNYNVSNNNQAIIYQFHYNQFKQLTILNKEKENIDPKEMTLLRKEYGKSKTKYLKI